MTEDDRAAHAFAPADEENVQEENPENQLVTTLQNQVPAATTIDVPTHQNPPNSKKIADHNKSVEEALVTLLSNSENTRLERQKAVFGAVIAFVAFQLVSFNGIILFLTLRCLAMSDSAVTLALLDYLKYYIGAVIVELIGMLVFITKSTFTSHAKDMINRLSPSKSQGK